MVYFYLKKNGKLRNKDKIKNLNFILEKMQLIGGLQLVDDVIVDVLLSTFVMFTFTNGSNS